MLLALVPAGGHIVTTTDCYRRTRQFIQTVLPKMGITATVLDPADMAGLEATLARQRVSLFFSGGRPLPRAGTPSACQRRRVGGCSASYMRGCSPPADRVARGKMQFVLAWVV